MSPITVFINVVFYIYRIVVDGTNVRSEQHSIRAMRTRCNKIVKGQTYLEGS